MLYDLSLITFGFLLCWPPARWIHTRRVKGIERELERAYANARSLSKELETQKSAFARDLQKALQSAPFKVVVDLGPDNCRLYKSSFTHKEVMRVLSALVKRTDLTGIHLFSVSTLQKVGGLKKEHALAFQDEWLEAGLLQWIDPQKPSRGTCLTRAGEDLLDQVRREVAAQTARTLKTSLSSSGTPDSHAVEQRRNA